MTKKGYTSFLLIPLLIAIFFISYVGYKYFNPLKIYYPDFGISIPRIYTVHGIDVSRHQGIINWKLVHDMAVNGICIDFAFIKATEGSSHIDISYYYNWKKSKEHGIMRGAYHYFKANKDAESQAKHFTNIVKLRSGDLAPVLDFEEDGNLSDAIILKKLKTWLQTVEAHYHIKPIIYVNIHYYNRYIKGNFDDYPIWIAHYYKGKPSMGVDSKWLFWQHNDRGRVNGITEYVDFNVFHGDKARLKYIGKK